MDSYPVRVSARRDPGLSRWLWLVKWLLALPHFLILTLLWFAVLVTTIAGYAAVVLTGRYPRPLFDFVVGVMRWTWRVQHYAYAALGTDRYPPFTLRDVADYPARIEIDYPPRLSRGLALVKWWLLALPHYIVVGFFLGGTVLAARGDDLGAVPWVTGGLVGLLVLVAAVILAFTGDYPAPIYDMVVGMDRWAIRVMSYALGLTDTYPPFRIDLGGSEPDGATRLDAAAAPAPVNDAPDVRTGAVENPASGWTAGRLTALVCGAFVSVWALGAVITGGVLAWADQTQRDAEGYLTAPAERLTTPGHAIAGPKVTTHPGLGWASNAVGTVRIRVTAAEPNRALFLGVGPVDDVAAYLADVPHAIAHGLGDDVRLEDLPGSRAPIAAAAAGIWTVSATGTGEQTVFVDSDAEDWTVVALNADGSAGVDLTAEIGARVPALPWLTGGLLAGGGTFLVLGLLLMIVPAARAAHAPSTPSELHPVG